MRLVSKIYFIICIITTNAFAAQYFEIEGGIFKAQKIDIQGYNQGNATQNWQSYSPQLRLEYWSKNDKSWNLGITFQPSYFEFSDPISSNLTYNDTVYYAGNNGNMKYQFHTLRQTANYPIWQSASGSYLRVGASLVQRYAQINFSDGNNSFASKGFIIFPVANIEANIRITNKYSFFTRSDFLPSYRGDFFYDRSVFDLLFAIRYQTEANNNFDIGIRTFFGGYDPQMINKFANRIMFNALVFRYIF